jgi:hypothetical protein
LEGIKGNIFVEDWMKIGKTIYMILEILKINIKDFENLYVLCKMLLQTKTKKFDDLLAEVSNLRQGDGDIKINGYIESIWKYHEIFKDHKLFKGYTQEEFNKTCKEVIEIALENYELKLKAQAKYFKIHGGKVDDFELLVLGVHDEFKELFCKKISEISSKANPQATTFLEQQNMLKSHQSKQEEEKKQESSIERIQTQNPQEQSFVEKEQNKKKKAKRTYAKR